MGPNNKHYFFAIIWTTLLIVLSVISKSTASKFVIFNLFGIDKAAHLIFYAILSWLWVRAFSFGNIKKHFIYSLILSTLLGVTLEYIQKHFTDGRSFEYDDMIANLVGSIIGLLVFSFLTKKN
jgi:VanZ family protein